MNPCMSDKVSNLWCPVSGSPFRETAIANTGVFAGSGFRISLSSHCLASCGSFPPFALLSKKSSSRKSVDWHAEHVTKSEKPIECDQFIDHGHSRHFTVTGPVFPTGSGNASKRPLHWRLHGYVHLGHMVRKLYWLHTPVGEDSKILPPDRLAARLLESLKPKKSTTEVLLD
ncbi:hypothetical protein CSKR_106421 [Clonorchis sinensis]|uniref:Uncharacterized protein n=1 Tax=Clonorchis sinensis TaxID=79923 RepID=A0A3R7D8D5_CLOSI|nr:hypothetical protein CSKR_106421 [Clonorchis sinensis]